MRLTREVFIEQDDFAEVPPPKFRRLKPGGSVRLKYGCIVTYQDVVKDEAGNILEVHATADLTTRSGEPNSGQKVKGTIHWVSAVNALDAEIRLYDRLFNVAEPGAAEDFMDCLNPESLSIVQAKIPPDLLTLPSDQGVQFERLGYFTRDSSSASSSLPVFNRTITLRDTWASK